MYGSRYPRPTSLAKVLGQTEYGDDVRHHMPENTLYVALIQPRRYSHAKILSIDYSEAEEMPGVVKVVTAKDVKGTNRIIEPLPHPTATIAGNENPIFCDKTIYRYGDVVGVVVADSDAHARAAAAKVKVELEPLPEYMSYIEAVAPGAKSIYENSPTNIYMQQPLIKGEDTRDVIDESYCSVEGSYYAQKEPHLSVEGDSLQCYYDEDGRIVIQNKSQALGWNTGAISEGIGVPADRIRLIMNPAGAAFGWGTFAGDSAIIAVAMMAVDRPVTMTMSYEEFMHFTGKRTSNFINGRLACDENGKLTALEFDVGCDHGAYFSNAYPELEALVRFLGYPYVVPNVRGLGRMGVTNHSFGTAYRGLGSPQCYTTGESLIDELARKMGEDPFEFRYKNVAREGDLTNNNYPYVEPSIAQLMDKARPIYEQMKKDIQGKNTEDKSYGIGIACGGFMCNLGAVDRSEVALELNSDGSVTHYNSWEDVGQGGDIGTLTHTVKALEPLGIKPEQVHLVLNDLGRCPDSGIAAASRSHFMNGNATIDAANKLLDAMRKPDGTYRTYDEMVADGIPTKYSGVYETLGKGGVALDFKTGQGSPNNCMNYGVFLALVEVDKRTGKTTVDKFVAVGDVGVIGNRLSVEGQAYGGISHTIGFALSEEYGDLKKSGTMAGAGIPYIEDIPDDITLIFEENPRQNGPHGSAGASELFQSGGHMAVINGIRDAVGVRMYELPARPERVKAAMDAKAAGQERVPDKYYLVPDMFDYIDSLQES
ncbi:MAG: xanthine dehydrogenase family protein, partial [Oscillospiraceae bacterium]|nr:xanthine dehydrogenase family protein [Oscillospiraceae bacterium]